VNTDVYASIFKVKVRNMIIKVQSWRWKQHIPRKYPYSLTGLHSVIT
jgi:hypothetical protein